SYLGHGGLGNGGTTYEGSVCLCAGCVAGSGLVALWTDGSHGNARAFTVGNRERCRRLVDLEDARRGTGPTIGPTIDPLDLVPGGVGRRRPCDRHRPFTISL
ncbi:MAG: hypothetical protein O3C27_14400, partial [Actinomycetota bacterium]|nr:hypothetical protein [Actinomycetota bacterium]